MTVDVDAAGVQRERGGQAADARPGNENVFMSCLQRGRMPCL